MPARHSYEALRRCVLLYAEDDDATAYLFQLALEETGAKLNVIRVTNGDEVLSFLLRHGVYEDAPTPDLLLLDLNLPRKNGFEVLEELPALPAFCRDIDVVVFSSSDTAEDR